LYSVHLINKETAMSTSINTMKCAETLLYNVTAGPDSPSRPCWHEKKKNILPESPQGQKNDDMPCEFKVMTLTRCCSNS